MGKKKIRYCSFCGRKETEVPALIDAGNSGFESGICICSLCNEMAYDVFKRNRIIFDADYNEAQTTKDIDALLKECSEMEDAFNNNSDDNKTFVKPSEINSILNDYVIGQEEAKKTLAVAIYNHQKRLNDKTGLIRKSNILMVGPSGSGKTLLAQTLAKALDVPFVIADATSLTEAGYVGDDVESILARLLQVANGDVSRAERGIVFIDEIDKISRKSENPSITRDVSGEGVQHALLKIIEGAEVSVPIGGGRKHPTGNNVMINTEKILFICGGAFEGMRKTNNKKNALGFNSVEIVEKEEKLSQDMLKSYGLTPELLGRLPILVELKELSNEDLCRVLTEPKNSIIKEYQTLFEQDEIELEFKDEAIKKIADLAIEKKIGARGLRSILEDTMVDIMYSTPDNENIKKVIIEESTLETKKPKYQYHKKIA